MGKILICDDDFDIIRSVKFMLESEGHDVVTTLSGRECIEKAKDDKPDYIFLDIMMPGMDGWETLRELKKNKELKHIPVSMLTVKPLTLETIKQEKMGRLVDYIVKPFSKEDLMETIGQVL